MTIYITLIAVNRTGLADSSTTILRISDGARSEACIVGKEEISLITVGTESKRLTIEASILTFDCNCNIIIKVARERSASFGGT